MSIFDGIRTVEHGIPVYKNFIGGKWVPASNGKTLDVTDPETGKVVSKVAAATKHDAEAAVAAAMKAKKEIGAMPIIDRIEIIQKAAKILEENKQEVMEAIRKEAGKPISQCKGEVNATIERMKLSLEDVKELEGKYLPGDRAPDAKKKFAIVIRQPRGIVLALNPFNYPCFIPNSKIVPAIVGGNALINKAASDDPSPLLLLTRVYEMAGMPKGSLNTLTGRGGEIGDVLVSHKDVNMISFTGSTSVGQHIAKIAGMKKLHLELGGKGCSIVLDDADLKKAVKGSVAGAIKFSGQRCDAIGRIFVHEKVADKFVKMVVDEVKSYKVGPTKNPDTKIGPLINDGACRKVCDLVEDAKKKGVKVVLGGKKGLGTHYEPTILDHVTPDMDIAWQETFGPIVVIIRVKNAEEALKLANESDYALDSSVYTQDIDKAVRIAKALDDGTVQINAPPAHGVGIFPFGGNENSGIGREGVGYSVDEMTAIHTIVFNVD